jgi:hypothetical protein
MSVLAQIRQRFFALRSVSPAWRRTPRGSGPRRRWQRRYWQLLDSNFSALQLNSVAANHVDCEVLPRPNPAKEIGFMRLKNSFFAAVAVAVSAVVFIAAFKQAETATTTSITPSTAGTITASDTVLFNQPKPFTDSTLPLASSSCSFRNSPP